MLTFCIVSTKAMYSLRLNFVMFCIIVMLLLAYCLIRLIVSPGVAGDVGTIHVVLYIVKHNQT